MTSDCNYAYFAQDANRWDNVTEAFWGSHDICPSLTQFHISRITRADLSAISKAGRWGNPRSNDKVWPLFCWCHHRRQKKQKGLAWWGYGSTSTNSFFPLSRRWQRNLLYISAQRRIGTMPLCKSMRIHSTPLLDARQISILVDGAPSRSACGHLSQLQIHQLLHLGGVVIYTGGLNGGLEPVQVTLPKLPLWEMGSTSEDTCLEVTLPRTTQGNSPLWKQSLYVHQHWFTPCTLLQSAPAKTSLVPV